MKRVTGLALAVLVVGAVASRGADPGPAKVEVRAVHIVKPLPPGLSTFEATETGISIDVIVTVPGKLIVGLDKDANKFTSFGDDKKTDLTQGQKPWIREQSRAQNPTIGAPCVLRVGTSAVPAPGATKIQLKATAAVKVGGAEKTVEEKLVIIKKDAKTKVGPAELRASGDIVTVSYIDTTPVASVVFLDKAGKEIKSERAGGGFSSRDAGYEYENDYRLEGKVGEFGVRLTYFSKIETVEVPIEINTGLGF